MSQPFDVIVIGSGLSEAATARRLAERACGCLARTRPRWSPISIPGSLTTPDLQSQSVGQPERLADLRFFGT
jgi:hypothetical protein